jgi:hypothetical protein
MPKAQRQAAASEVRSLPQVGDKVCPPRSEVVYEVSKVHVGGDEVDLHLPGTNLERFRVRTDALTYVERKPPASTSNPFNPEPVFDARGMVKSITTVQQESLSRLDSDTDILNTYLKAQRAPKDVIEALEELTVEHYKAWTIAMGKIKKELGE